MTYGTVVFVHVAVGLDATAMPTKKETKRNDQISNNASSHSDIEPVRLAKYALLSMVPCIGPYMSQWRLEMWLG